MEEKVFYDIHCHAMNLSHPNLSALLRRVNIPLVLAVYTPAISIFMRDKIEKTTNTLSIMESDMGSFFLLMEHCLKKDNPLWISDKGHRGLRVGEKIYGKIILTPLMMDFGYKNMRITEEYCKNIVEKPIVEQVIDVFWGIKKYINESSEKLFEIYPFLGINTKNYTMKKINIMLDKYFGDYDGTYGKLRENYQKLSGFSGNIGELGSNCFSGIKLYPPLGFDPWPGDGPEREKVKYLYEYCMNKGIPVTVHCSDGGFIVGDPQESERRTSPDAWEEVLIKYPDLKINFGHMGKLGKLKKMLNRQEWAQKIIDYILRYDNVYTDFSNCGFSEEYYKSLRKLIGSYSEKQQKKINDRILFGSDYMVNLLYCDSYSSYIRVFSESGSLNEVEKSKFSSANPEKFLFTRK
ncbi:MAG: amidohydrolase family protein [Caulobacteraceae bacterium]